MAKTKKWSKTSIIGLILLPCLLIGSQTGLQQKRPEVPYVPTPEEVVAEMLNMANVDPDDVIYDLGCGDGRIVIKAAKELGCRGVGRLRIERGGETHPGRGRGGHRSLLLRRLVRAKRG